jgi:hypothetical protein
LKGLALVGRSALVTARRGGTRFTLQGWPLHADKSKQEATMMFSQRVRRDVIEQQSAERRQASSSSSSIDPEWYTTHGQGD